MKDIGNFFQHAFFVQSFLISRLPVDLLQSHPVSGNSLRNNKISKCVSAKLLSVHNLHCKLFKMHVLIIIHVMLSYFAMDRLRWFLVRPLTFLQKPSGCLNLACKTDGYIVSTKNTYALWPGKDSCTAPKQRYVWREEKAHRRRLSRACTVWMLLFASLIELTKKPLCSSWNFYSFHSILR